MLSLLSINCVKAPEAPRAEMGTEVVAPEPKGEPKPINIEKSEVKWIGTKKTAQHNGTVKLSGGDIYLDGNTLTGGKFSLNMESLINLDLKGEDNEKLVGHLKSKDFFDVGQYPIAEFVITSIGDVGPDGKTEIIGNLKIKDITKSIKFPAKINFGEDKRPISANANFNINRFDWNIVYPGMPDNLIEKEINLDLNISL